MDDMHLFSAETTNIPQWAALGISLLAAGTAFFRGRTEKDMTLLDQVQEERLELKKDRSELRADMEKCKKDYSEVKHDLEITRLELRAAQEEIALLKIENNALKNHIRILEGVS